MLNKDANGSFSSFSKEIPKLRRSNLRPHTKANTSSVAGGFRRKAARTESNLFTFISNEHIAFRQPQELAFVRYSQLRGDRRPVKAEPEGSAMDAAQSE